MADCRLCSGSPTVTVHSCEITCINISNNTNTHGQTYHNIDNGLWYQTFFFVYLEVPATRVTEPFYMCVRFVFLSLVLSAGLFGNALTMVVLGRPSLRRQQISSRFVTLAFCDFCCCLVRFIPWVNLIYAFRDLPLPLLLSNDHWCRFTEYFFTSLHVGESWLIAFITLERAFAVVFPLKGGITSKYSHGIYIIAFCVFGPFVLLCYIPFITVYVPNIGCAVKAYPDMLWNFIVGTTAISALPLTTIFVCNISLIVALRRQNVKVNSDKRTKKFKRVTNMVLAVSMAFLATVFPKASNVLMKISNPQWAWLQVSDDVATILWDLNYAVNFYLYVITGKSMRREIGNLCGCQSRDRVGKNSI